jgi:predicted transcriptional regulator
LGSGKEVISMVPNNPIPVKFSEETQKWLKERAKKRESSVTQVIRDAVLEYKEKLEKSESEKQEG